MNINKTDKIISVGSEQSYSVNLRWFRGANRYNNGATRYKGKYKFRLFIGRAKQQSSQRRQNSNQPASERQ